MKRQKTRSETVLDALDGYHYDGDRNIIVIDLNGGTKVRRGVLLGERDRVIVGRYENTDDPEATRKHLINALIELGMLVTHGEPLRPETLDDIYERHVKTPEKKAELKEARRIGMENPIPIRARVSNWTHGSCQRCLHNGVKDGDIVVRIYGFGWWHDTCYRVINPGFYEGI